LTGWFCLGNADHENGCLRYIRGSHKKSLRHHARTQTLGFSQGITDFGTPDDLANEKAYRAEPGDLLIHHALTIHRADGNQSEIRDRPALGFVYISDRAKEDREGGEAYRKKLAENLASQGKI
jgi:phytanoyl-CoA hydroxylase